MKKRYSNARSRARAKRTLAAIDKVYCRQIGDRWYVTYGGLVRNHYASGRIAFQHAFEIADMLRSENLQLQEVPLQQ